MIVKVHQCKNRHFHLSSKLIEWHQGINYSHYAIEYKSETGNQLILDATRKNIACYNAKDYFDNRYHSMKSFEIFLNINRVDFLKWQEQHLGKDYPEKQILGIVLGIALKKNDDRKMICSELVLDMLVALKGFSFTGNRDLFDMNDLEKILRGI